jgi:large subunit ribosomal protein L17
MGTIGRKNVHGKGGVRFKTGFTSSKNKSLLRNLATDLIVHGKVETTLSTAKQLSALADRLVTYGKRGDLNSRRLAAAIVRNVVANEKGNALKKLFDEIAPSYQNRNGGYTSVLKTGIRKGDNAVTALVTWVK